MAPANSILISSRRRLFAEQGPSLYSCTGDLFSFAGGL